MLITQKPELRQHLWLNLSNMLMLLISENMKKRTPKSTYQIADESIQIIKNSYMEIYKAYDEATIRNTILLNIQYNE